MSNWRDVTHPTTARLRGLFAEQPCELVSYHAPIPTMVEYHHQKPVFLQNRLYGKIMYGPSLWVCSNCNDSIHAWLYWLLGDRTVEPHVGRTAKDEAYQTYAWFRSEVLRLGLAEDPTWKPL